MFYLNYCELCLSLILLQVQFAPAVLPGEDPQIWMATRQASRHLSCVIYFHIVQFYPGDRVMRQFGMIQTIPSAPTVWESRGVRSQFLPDRAVPAWQNRMNNVFEGEFITVDTPCELKTYYISICIITFLFTLVFIKFYFFLAPWATMEYREWFGAPRIYNPMVAYIERRAIPRGYMEPVLQDYASRSMQQVHDEILCFSHPI